MQIKEYAKELKLPYIRMHHKILLEEARQQNLDYETFLKETLQLEYEQRQINSIERRIREARFSSKKTLELFDFKSYSVPLQKKMNELINLSFIEEFQNIILIGNPGVGKTHYAIALGMKACTLGKSVLFISVPNLIIELKEAMTNHQIHRYKKKFSKYDLVILDELGYVSFDKEGSEILFNLISTRNQIGSIIITSNLTFDRWEEIFKDPILTGAFVDRIAHKSHVLDMSGESYRIKETKDWLSK